jgi:hypothetical protein
MRLLKSVLRALAVRSPRRPAPQARIGLEALENRETPSGGLRPVYYGAPAPEHRAEVQAERQVEVQIERQVEHQVEVQAENHGGHDDARPHA